MVNNSFLYTLRVSLCQKFLRSKQAKTIITLLIFLFPPICEAQNLLNKPQRAVIDAKRNRILVSNYNTGDIIQIDSAGNQSYFVQGADFVDGLEIVGDTIYGTGNHRNIRAYNLETKTLVMDTIFSSVNPGDEYLSSITSDSAGHLFISCPGTHTIYKLRISDKSYWIFAQNNGLTRPNGMLLEKEKNRIVVIDDSPNSIIHAISLADSTVSTLMTTSLSSPDGIVRDRFGSYYVGGYYLDGIYKIDSAFSKPPTLFYAGNNFVYPTYDEKDHTLLVTYYENNSWTRIPLQVLDFISDYQTGHAPLTVQFSENFETLHQVTSWNWDFENDGVFDSNIPNPTHEYSQFGKYTVRLQTTIDTATYTIIKQDFVNVFDGTSAVKFKGNNNFAFIHAAPSLNLQENFTMEAVIKPEAWSSSTYGSTVFDKSALRVFLIGNSLGPTRHYTLVTDVKLQDETKVKLSAPNNTIKLNIWQHIAVSYNSLLSQFKMYVNGVECNISVIGSNQLSGALFNNDTIPLFLGNDLALSTGYKGDLDELRVWNVIRTDSEILENIDNSLAGNEPGLMGYWQMDEGKGTELIDKTNAGNNGRLESAIFTNGVDLTTLSVDNEETSKVANPHEFLLKQNFPNPFNPSTTIQYQLTSPSYVKVIVSNILGETVATLVDGFQNAGIHESIFLADKLSSGIYYYQLVAGNYRQTKKMILLR
jgi:PKD repeat protein